MNPRFAQFPEYVEACHKQDVIRDSAFLELPERLCGVPVLPMTPRHLAILTHCENGFVTGGEVLPEHIPQLLWCLSPDFSPTNHKAREKITLAVCALPFQKSVLEIRAFIDETFMDAPSSGGPGGESFNSWLAGLVDVLAREYGWTQREILGLPLACVFQYLRVIRQRTGDKTPLLNKLSDEARARAVEKSLTKN